MLSHPSFVVHAVITLQGIESPRQPPRQRHYSDPLATAGCKAFCPLPQLAPYHPLAAPYPPSCSAQQRPHLLTALLGDLATLLVLPRTLLSGYQSQIALDVMRIVKAFDLIKGATNDRAVNGPTPSAVLKCCTTLSP
jgi:hypothetical protein